MRRGCWRASPVAGRRRWYIESARRVASRGCTHSVVHTLGVAAGQAVYSEAPLHLGADGHLYGTTVTNSAGPPPALAAGSLFRITRAPQAPLIITGAPESATFGTSFTVGTSGGSG